MRNRTSKQIRDAEQKIERCSFPALRALMHEALRTRRDLGVTLDNMVGNGSLVEKDGVGGKIYTLD